PRVILPGIEANEFRTDVADVGGLQRERERVEKEVNAFLEDLTANGVQKKIEINFCPTARAAADAMQPSGWRRSAFIRLPWAQREFSKHLRRLFIEEQV